MRPRQNKGRLGAFLIERGMIRARDLERALEIQRVAGGHLGTNLLELGVVAEKDLLRAIGELHDHATVSGETLRRVPKELAAMVPRELVRRHSIVPFEIHGNTVYIASQRPGDLHIENEVTLATSRLTRTFLGLEVRVQEALHRLHGHSFPLRFARLAARLDGHDLSPAGPTSVPAPAAPGAKTNRPDPQDDSSTWISSGEDADPTLSNTVGRSISWADFEEIVSSSEAGSETTEIPWQKKFIPTAGKKPEPTGSAARIEASTEAAPQPPKASAEASGKPDASERPDAAALAQGSESADGTPELEATQGAVRPFPSSRRSLRPRRPNRFLDSLERGSQQSASEEKADPDSGSAADRDSPAEASSVSPSQLEDVSARSAGSNRFKEVHDALQLATNLDEIGAALMSGLRPFFRRRLLLAKRGQRLVGWRADGPGVRPKDLSDLSFSIERASPFLAIENGSRFWLGAYHHDPGHDAIHAVLGNRQAPDCMVMALRAGTHIVGFVYGDNESDTVTGQPLREFLELAESAGRSLERLVLERKRNRIRQSRKEELRTKEIEKQPPDPWAPREAS